MIRAARQASKEEGGIDMKSNATLARGGQDVERKEAANAATIDTSPALARGFKDRAK